MKIKHRISRENEHSKQILHYIICLQVVFIQCLLFYAYEDTKILCDILRKTGRLRCNLWAIPQEQISLVIHHVIFLTNDKLTLKLYIWSA